MKTSVSFIKRAVAIVLTLATIIGCFSMSAVSASAAEPLPLAYADVNMDGVANSKDVLTLYKIVATGDTSALSREARLCADCDGSGSLTMKDVQILFAAVSGKTALSAAAPAPSEYELEVFRLVNIEREKAGVAPLQYGYDIQLFGDIRAEECSIYFSHTRLDGRICFSVFDDYQNNYYAGGENIAAFQRSPEQVVSDWMNSPGHRDNMLNPYFSTLVVGCAEIPDYPGYYSWAQMFTY